MTNNLEQSQLTDLLQSHGDYPVAGLGNRILIDKNSLPIGFILFILLSRLYFLFVLMLFLLKN